MLNTFNKDGKRFKVKVNFEYRISGMTHDAEGAVSGEGKDYDAALQDAYNNLCTQRHNQYLTVTFRKVD